MAFSNGFFSVQHNKTKKNTSSYLSTAPDIPQLGGKVFNRNTSYCIRCGLKWLMPDIASLVYSNFQQLYINEKVFKYWIILESIKFPTTEIYHITFKMKFNLFLRYSVSAAHTVVMDLLHKGKHFGPYWF